MVAQSVIVAVVLLAMVKSLTLASFTVEPLSVTPPESLIKDHGNGTYTIAEGAAVHLTCKLTHSPENTFFLKWIHPTDTNKHIQTSSYDGCEDEESVSRNLFIKKIQQNDSGSYRCHRKKRGRGNSWDDLTPYTINITVGASSHHNSSIQSGVASINIDLSNASKSNSSEMEKNSIQENNNILSGNTDPPNESISTEPFGTINTLCNNDELLLKIAEVKDTMIELMEQEDTKSQNMTLLKDQNINLHLQILKLNEILNNSTTKANISEYVEQHQAPSTLKYL